MERKTMTQATKRLLLAAGATIVLTVSAVAQEREAASGDVLTYHARQTRTGNFVVPSLTWERAATMRPDQGFDGKVDGNVYAQPLYWSGGGAGSGMLLMATEDNKVHALDGRSGAEIWTRTLGRPVSRATLRCGNINPLGITGTPVIDAPSQALFVDAMIDDGGPRHRVFGLALKDGALLTGWPIDVSEALRAKQQTFNARDQNERGALAILDGTLFVPFGGHFGDCGDYHGWVVGLSLRDPKLVASWSTRARGGGVWAPGGIAVAGQSLFVATGNTFGASVWSDGEAIIRLDRDLHRSNSARDFFAPADWRALDARDADLGGSNPVAFDLDESGGPRALMIALGKDGRAYLLDRNNLGGIGGALAVETLSDQPIRTGAAVYSVGDGAYVALQARGARCPAGDGAHGADRNLVVLKVTGGAKPALSTAWCGTVRGAGSPIVTTTDGRANSIVWMVGAEGDNRLHGFRGDNGAPLFSGSSAMAGLRHFGTLIATQDRLFVGADGRVYAYSF
jgi:hypothetical protein